MIEVEVTCLCNMMRLPDIGQVMTKGQVLYLDRDKAEASEDLRVAWRAKGINVKYVTRCQERVGADALTSIPTRRVPARVLPKRAVFVAEQPPPEEAPEGQQAGVSREEVERIVREALSAQTAALLRALGEQAAGIRGDVSGAVQKAVSGLQIAPVGGIVQAGAREESFPVYIPDGLVNSDLKADVTVKQGKSEGGGVDDAAKALRELKKKKGVAD